jgi:CubicO group peptidase (beta-lactamase class C family)
MNRIFGVSAFAAAGSLWLLFASTRGGAHEVSATRMHELDERIARIENFVPISLAGNEPPVRLNLRQLMEISNVPGLSVAVFDKYKLAWARSYGVTSSGGKAVTPHTLFPACSISKPVAAIAALRLVEQGKFSLDADVNLKLKIWKLPENQFTSVQKVTARRILTHTAGTTVHGFLGYEPDAPVPSLVQILNAEPPAHDPPVRVDYVPGTKQRYSGGGFLALQQLMMDVTDEPFRQVTQELVFEPLHLKDSMFVTRPPESDAAAGHEENGESIPGGWNANPELAAGGLWTTPSDLGRVAMEIPLAKEGKPHHLLSPEMARQMLKLQVDPTIQNLEGGSAMRMGLGWVLGGPSESGQFGHSGVNKGFRAELTMWESGKGIVVMVNNWSFASECVMRYLMLNIAREYGWGDQFANFPRTVWPYADTVVLATAKLRGAKAAITQYHELKDLWTAESGDAIIGQALKELRVQK